MVRHVFAFVFIGLTIVIGPGRAAEGLPPAPPAPQSQPTPELATPELAAPKMATPELAAPELAGHEAVYAVTLASTRSGSGIVSASGEMLYKFTDVCDGWTTETHNTLNLVDDHGDPIATSWDFLSWESRDGLSYRFRVRSLRDGEEIEAIEGSARLDGKGQGGRAAFTQPGTETLSLPPGTLFPTAHTAALVAQSAAGDRSLLRLVFDGTLMAPPFEVNALFGPALPPGAPSELKTPLLDLRPSWRVHMAYFQTDTLEPLPYHEVTVRYHDNGIGQELVQDYGTFRLSTHLKKLTPLPKPSC